MGTLLALPVEAGVTHSHYYVRRRQQARARRIRRLSLAAVLLLALLALIGVIVYAGSPGTIAKGVKIDGVAVGGLSTAQAAKTLERRSHASLGKPVEFVADGHSFRISAADLGLVPDWKAAAASARGQGDGFAPVRGVRRVKLRLFGGDVSARATYRQAALKAELARIAAKVDSPHRDAALVRRGLHAVVLPSKVGNVLDRQAAGAAIVTALASLDRGEPVTLPMTVDNPRVTAPMLAKATAQLRTAVSAPVVLTLGADPLPDSALADRHAAEAAGERRCEAPDRRARRRRVLQGAAEDGRSARARRAVPRRVERCADPSHPETLGSSTCPRPPTHCSPPRCVRPTGRRRSSWPPSRPSAPPRRRRRWGSRARLELHDVLRRRAEPDPQRPAGLSPGRQHADRTRQGVLVQRDDGRAERGEGPARGARDHQRRAGERPRRRRLPGLDDRLQRRLRGGLPITARTNHALYISHYPQGRDATVNYPDIDLKFVNDTDHWLLLRTFVSSQLADGRTSTGRRYTARS